MPTPTLHTERLVLRPVCDADQENVFKGFSHPEVTRYFDLTYPTLEATAAQMEWYKTNSHNGTGYYWAVTNTTGDFMGVFSIYFINQTHHKAEIGYWLLPEFWGKGFASEALKTILHFAQHHLSLHRISAEIEPENTDSWKLLQKLGFELEGTFRDYEFKNGKYNDLQVWAKLW
jgi:ribosomal-protein-alanine N-acetyltransferase